MRAIIRLSALMLVATSGVAAACGDKDATEERRVEVEVASLNDSAAGQEIQRRKLGAFQVFAKTRCFLNPGAKTGFKGNLTSDYSLSSEERAADMRRQRQAACGQLNAISIFNPTDVDFRALKIASLTLGCNSK